MSVRRYKPIEYDEMPGEMVKAEDFDHLYEEYQESQRLLRASQGLKALLPNGMPQTGSKSFDEVLATYPIAEMIQRGWLENVFGFDDLPTLERSICKFFRVSEISQVLSVSFISR